MKTKTISYTKTFQVYQFVNDKISIEDTFPSTVSDEECFKQLMERIDALGKIAYPHLYQQEKPFFFPSFNLTEDEKKKQLEEASKWQQQRPTPPPVIDISKEKEQPMLLEDMISSCTEIDGMDGLESYRKLVESQPLEHIKKLFDNKLKELNKT